MTERYKPIKITDKQSGKVYMLDFNRATVKESINAGLKADKLTDDPFLLYDLFYWSFMKNHKDEITRDETDKYIDDVFGGVLHFPEGMPERLAQLYIQTFETLTDKERKEKNSRLTVEM